MTSTSPGLFSTTFTSRQEEPDCSTLEEHILIEQNITRIGVFMDGRTVMEPPSLAKFQRPRLERAYNRIRLFHALDAVESAPMVWISAPAGSGKTTLTASYLDYRKTRPLWYQVDDGDADLASFFYYLGLLAKQAAPGDSHSLPTLTPEYLSSLTVFARNFFRQFFRRMTPAGVLVLDNYQDVGMEAVLDSMLPLLISELPPGCRIIVISRSDPPVELTRYRASREMAILTWDDMRLTEDEVACIASAHDLSDWLDRDPGLIQQLYAGCQGWAAGLVLLLAKGKSSIAGPDPVAGREVMFDYFLQEILAGTDPELVDFLLRTSYLSRITLPIARSLTGNKQAEQHLQDLCKRNYFITRLTGKKTGYQYHDLFREFLQEQAARVFTDEEQSTLLRRAGRLLLDHGESDSGIYLLLQAESWDEAVKGILGSAAKMLANGRAQILRQWFSRLPVQLAENNSWITYWMGMCDLGIQPAQAQELFTSAYQNFREIGDIAGQYNAWAGIVDAIYMSHSIQTQLDPWIAEFDSLQERGIAFPDRDIEERVYASLIRILFWRQPYHPMRTARVAHAQKLFDTSCNVELRLQLGADLLIQEVIDGKMHECVHIADSLEHLQKQETITPLARINYLMMIGFRSFFMGRIEEAARVAMLALDEAEETGCHVLDAMIIGLACYAALIRGDIELANNLLKRMSQQLAYGPDTLNQAMYLGNCAWRDAAQGKLPRAEHSLRRMLEVSTNFGVVYPSALAHYQLAHVLMESGRTEEGRKELRKARETMDCDWINYNCTLLDALYLCREGQHAQAGESLQEALATAVEAGFGNPVFWRPEQLAEIALEALLQDIETEHMRNLIRSHKLVPPSDRFIPENWPFRVRIHCFGQFRLLVDDKPIRMEKKAQKKPIEMLKALIALGGNGISVGRITDVLWPDTDADRAHHSFKVNLHRLRRLIGVDSVILHDGRLSLDPRLAWCDTRMFEQDREQALRTFRAGDFVSTQKHIERLLYLYNAPFLPEDDMACIYTTRKRFQNQLMGLLGDLGDALYKIGDYAASAQLYSAGLDIDPLTEVLTQGLLRCYLELRQPAQALRIYGYCREMLQRELGLKPSPDTEALAQAAREISA